MLNYHGAQAGLLTPDGLKCNSRSRMDWDYLVVLDVASECVGCMSVDFVALMSVVVIWFKLCELIRGATDVSWYRQGAVVSYMSWVFCYIKMLWNGRYFDYSGFASISSVSSLSYVYFIFFMLEALLK